VPPDPLLLLPSWRVITMPHAVLLLPELLENILGFTDGNDNVTNTLVCKKWSEVALDLMWRDVESLPRLLSLLRRSEIRNGSTVRRLFSTYISPAKFIAGYDLRSSLTGSQTQGTGKGFRSMAIVCIRCDIRKEE